MNEPLGQTRIIPMVYPDEVIQPDFKGFGVGVVLDEPAKSLIYDCASDFTKSDYPQDLIKTKQLEGFDEKRNLRFGMVDKNKESNGVGDTFAH